MLKEKKDELIKGFYELFNSRDKKESINNFQKKGSEIKQGVNTMLVKINEDKSKLIDKMNEQMSNLPVAPTKECDYSESYKHLIDYLPKKFDYNQIYNGEQYIDSSSGVEVKAVKVPAVEERSAMQEYNNLVNRYVEMCIAKIKLEAMKRNLEDSKKYDLSVEQVAILGI